MTRYIDLFKSKPIRDMLNHLSPVAKAKCEEFCTIYPDLPRDYLDFLIEVGYGVIGQRQYMLYDGVLPLSELLAEACDPNLADLLVFGDTLGGTCHGFDPSDAMQVIEVDLDTQEAELAASCFEDFIRTLLISFTEV